MQAQRQQLLPLFQKNEVLFGHDATAAAIAYEVDGDASVRVFFRDGETVRGEAATLQPLMLLEGDDPLGGWSGEAQIEKLAGSGAFNRLALFADLKQLDDAKVYLQKKTGKTPSAGDAPYWYFSDPLQQFLLLSGRTHFLGMTFRELKRLQLDIETYCQSGFNFPSAARENDRITAIALSDSTGWERLISGKEHSEAEMLRELVQEIQRRDPDVIEGHNIFRFDLEYIEARAKRHKVALNFGRDGSRLSGHGSRMQMAERTITYRKYEIFGRHIIDTWILAQHYDVATRELESFGLKDIARHFGVAGAARTYVPGTRPAGISIMIPTPCFATPSTTCAKPGRSPRSFRPATSSRRKFSRSATRTCRCAATPPKSTPCSCASICISAIPCPTPTRSAPSSAASPTWSIRARPIGCSTATSPRSIRQSCWFTNTCRRKTNSASSPVS
jgi:hypothetical protein